MITSRGINELAVETGFRPDVVEKVLRLHGILGRLAAHPTTQGGWVLKGGTAINLLHLDVPRLSVDIDLNFVGTRDVEEMRLARPDFERALSACCERENCSVRRAPSEHAGGKFRLRFPSLVGGSQSLEIDVSYVSRVPLLGIEQRSVRFPPNSKLGVPTLKLEELAAGKFTALLQRTVARDAYDAAGLLELAPDLLSRQEFRIAFVCYMAASRFDVRSLVPDRGTLDERAVRLELEPMLRRVDGEHEKTSESLLAWMEEKLGSSEAALVVWSDGERDFLDGLLSEGIIRSEGLTDDPELQERIRAQPMLQWKAKNVREFRYKQ
ncbi:MAG: nucleotidyl transferase AbiEii/AbiGii toxin family protein [bacterium]|nr:nucleotidyl transferase AbiEii/AbiGii toxin family protein [bacterium]